MSIEDEVLFYDWLSMEDFLKRQAAAEKQERDDAQISAAPLKDLNIGSQDFDEDQAWIQTYSGRRFCPLSPNPDAIVLQDIAHSLAMQCRFNGHCKKFYSVAQHSVYV